MSLRIILILLLAAPVLAAGGPAKKKKQEKTKPAKTLEAPARTFEVLTAGRYAVKIEGMLCRTCALAITLEALTLPQIKEARADFDSEELIIEIKAEQKLKVSDLKKVLRRATKKINLMEFRIASIRYLP